MTETSDVSSNLSKFNAVQNSFLMQPETIRLKEIKPELTGYIRDALSLLDSAEIPDEKIIHDIRVLLKRARSVIRLTKSLSDSDFQERNLSDLRQAAGVMASWRDTSVHRRILRDLRKGQPVLFHQLAGNARVQSLIKKPDADVRPGDEVAGIEEIRKLLKRTLMRLRFINMSDIDPENLLREVESTYTKVAGKFLRCRINPKAGNIHEFRKKTKDILYQLVFFRPLNNKEVRSLEKKLDSLSKNLGKYNDLSQLIAALDYSYPESSGDPSTDELIVRIKGLQDTYLSRIWPVATKIFCPGKKLFNLLGFKILVFQNEEEAVHSPRESESAIYTYSK
jgi:CHAD domain-containing protein